MSITLSLALDAYSKAPEADAFIPSGGITTVLPAGNAPDNVA